jgi:phospholipid/cholesterol/gamma-HCH transport system substrate-binding protein
MQVKASRVVRVFVITLVAIATSVLLYLLINNFQFRRGTTVRVHFNTVGDLNPGAWVRKAGVKVGSVTKVEPAPDEKTVIVSLTFRPGEIVRMGDKFSLISKGILGDVYIEQIPGPKSVPEVQQGHLFEGEPFFSLNDLLGGSGMQLVSDVGSSIKVIGDILRKNEASLNSTIQDIQKTAANARVISENVAAATKSLPELSAQIVSTLQEMDKTLRELQATTDRLASTLEGNLTSGSEDLAASLKSIRKTSNDIQLIVEQLSAKGSVIGTLSSAETSQRVDETLKNLQAISASLLKTSQETEKIVEGVRSVLGSP